MTRVAIDKEFVEMIKQNDAIIYKVASFYTDNTYPIGDLYQEVVINLWKGFSSFRGDSKCSTWIYRIALNTCISFMRRNKHKPVFVDITMDVPVVEEGNDQIKELYVLINKLEKVERALVLLYLDDKPYKEIAEIMGMSTTNVGTKLNRIKDKLKRMSNN